MAGLNNIVSNLAVAGRNWHVSAPLGLALGLGIAAIWLPEQYQARLHATERLLSTYGILAAANSGPTKPKEEPEPNPLSSGPS